MQSKPRGSAESNLIALLNFIADPAVIVDKKGRFLVVNEAFVELTGLKKKELLGTAFFELRVLRAENKALLLKNLAKRMKGAQVEPYEIGFKNRTGETRYAEVKAKKIEYSGHPADLVVFRDITRRKENAKRLKEYSEKMVVLVDEKAREIKESKEKLEKIFDSSPDAIVVTDLNGKLIEVNEAAVQLYGCSSKAELIDKSAFELIARKEQQKLSLLIETILKDGAVNNAEYVFLTEEGRELPVELSASFFKDSADNPVGFVAVIKDISERKKSEASLEKSEKEKCAVLDSMSELVSYQDLNHRVLWVNRKAAESVNVKVEQLTGRYCHEIWANSVNPCAACPIEETIKKGQPQQGEITTPDGRIWSISGYPIRDEKGNLTNIVEVSTEITEKKKAEEALKKSEANYRELINGMNDTVWVIDLDAKFIDVNDAAVKVLGYSREELLNMGPLDIDNSLSKEQILHLIRNMPADQVQVFETAHTTKDGRKIPVEISSSLVTYQGKQAILSIARDITERQRLEHAHRTSEELFRAISTSAMDAIILLDDRGKITYWNPASERIFGYTNKEALGKKLDNLIIPKQHRRLHSESSIKAFESGQNHRKSIGFKALRKNGTEVPVELSVSMLKIKDKKHLLGIIRDSSERKKMETTLREAEERYHALFDKAPLGILVVDETATAVEFNEEAHRQLGYTREEFAKLKVFDYEVIETPEETRARMKKIMREGKDEFETKHLTKNGELRDVIIAAQVIELAGKKFFHLITKDVTEQKKIERELKIEKNKLEVVTENIGAGVGIISKDYRILWVNKLLKQINGDCEGKMCYSTFNRLTEVCPHCGVKKVFEDGVPIDIHEYSNVDDKGNRFWVELIVTPIKDEKGNVVAALELAVNITERKIMENKLAEYSQKLEKLVEKRTEQLKRTQAKLVKSEQLATIGELAAMVGHDLRNPLTGIMGAAYYLKTKHSPELCAKGKEMLETIENAITYSNKIVNDLLEYSRDLKLELGEVTPKAMLENALSLLEVPEKIKIVDATEDKPTVKADTEKMRRVLVNIIKNAFDAMPEGGTLTVNSREVKGKLEITFKDTGTGMSKETLSKLEGGVPLFTTKAKGMGFGVPICKRIAEAHGGKLSVESKIGKGTTVTITVPVNPKPVDESEEKWIFNESMLQTITAKQKAKQPKK